MRLNILQIILPLFFATQSHAEGINTFVFSDEHMSCGAWINNNSHKGNMIMAQYDSWIRGFFSGINFETTKQQIKLNQLPDRESINLYIVNYCNKNPLNSWVGAVFDLKRDLTEWENAK